MKSFRCVALTVVIAAGTARGGGPPGRCAGELPLLELQEAEELGGGGAGLDLAEVDVTQREARQRLRGHETGAG